jgi:hypothetical protein
VLVIPISADMRSAPWRKTERGGSSWCHGTEVRDMATDQVSARRGVVLFVLIVAAGVAVLDTVLIISGSALSEQLLLVLVM